MNDELALRIWENPGKYLVLEYDAPEHVGPGRHIVGIKVVGTMFEAMSAHQATPNSRVIQIPPGPSQRWAGMVA